MELSSRKQAVLRAIVRAYIETGEPIGSKILTEILENAPSSATLRNEMSELCELGLLKQPHTSAGRIPTSDGLRLYINSLMTKKAVSQQTREFIDSAAKGLHCESESIPAAVSESLSRLTGLPAISCFITDYSPRIKRIELMPITRGSVMLLLIMQDGRARNRIFRLSSSFDDAHRKAFLEIADKHIKGKPISQLTKPYMQGLLVHAGIYALELTPLLTAVFETAGEIKSSALTLSGEQRLYNMSGNEENARAILELIKRRDPIISLLERTEQTGGVVFGADTNYGELRSETIVAARFSAGDKYKGYIGVIGTDRMSYDEIIPDIKYTAEVLTKIMTEAQKDMED